MGAEPAAEATLEPVAVRAQRLSGEPAAERALTPGNVTIVDTETLQGRGVSQLSEMLRYVPGVYAESYNGNDDVFYSSRGSNLDATDYDRNGIKFLQDGLPLTAADGNNHNRAIDPLNSRYVTIAHGANALAYGASTLGGAIDVTSPTARNSPRLSAALSGASFGQWSARGLVSGSSGSVDGLLSAETLHRDGFRDHSRQDRHSVYANVGWERGARMGTRLHATWSDHAVQLPRELSRAQVDGNPRQARADAIDGDHGKQVRTWRLATKTTLADLFGGGLEIGVSYERQQLYHPIVSTPFFSLLIDTDHDDAGAVLRFRRNAGKHAVLVGANFGHSTMSGGNYANNGGERGALLWAIDDDARSTELFALDRWSFAPGWTLVYGAQYVNAARDVAGVKADFNAVNPRLGVIRKVGTGSEWYASASRVFEAPTTFELTDDAHGGASALDAMHGIGVEAGMRSDRLHGRARLSWDVTAYYTVLRDEILSIDDPDAPGTSLSANIDATTHAGVEALLSASLPLGDDGHRLEPLLGATFNAFAFDSDPTYGNNRLPGAPRWFARGELLFRHARGAFIGPTFDLIGARYADFSNTYQLGSHALFGARAGYASAHWDIYVEGRNLLDREHIATLLVRDVAAADAQVLFPGAPRSIHAGVRYRF